MLSLLRLGFCQWRVDLWSIVSDSSYKPDLHCRALRSARCVFSPLRRSDISLCGLRADTADTMINLAHKLGSPQDLITYTQIYVQQPRNSDDNLSIPYCQKDPANAELQGLFQCQFAGSNCAKFAGGLNLGSKGTMPFGFTGPLHPLGGWYAASALGILKSTNARVFQSCPSRWTYF